MNKLFERSILTSLNPSLIKLGLDQIACIDRALGSPSRAFKTIHVGGTNGKGSVTTKMAYTYFLSGKKVGLYTSPHICSYRERIQIDGRLIEEECANRLIEKIEGVAALQKIELTYFELLTLLAFLYFAENGVEIAIIEVGLGGRLDATNIILPEVTVITSIGFDHRKYLGNTLEKIAFEKAGIMKPKVACVIGPKSEPKLLFREQAYLKQSPLIEVEGDFEDYDVENSQVARATLHYLGLDKEVIDQGISIRPPCRFEIREYEIPVIFDVAHNLPAMDALFLRIKRQKFDQKVRVVAAFSNGKEVDEMLCLMEKEVDQIHLCQLEHERHFPLSNLQRMPSNAILEKGLEEALQNAYASAYKRNQPLLICGTFFMMEGSLAFFETKSFEEPKHGLTIAYERHQNGLYQSLWQRQ